MTTELVTISQEIARLKRSADIGARAWSSAYHLCFGIAGVLGLLVSLLPQLMDATSRMAGLSQDAWVSIFSTIAAALTFIGGFAGFERKWHANRATRAAMQKLEILMTVKDADIKAIRERLFAAIDQHEAGITGPAQPPDTPPARDQAT